MTPRNMAYIVCVLWVLQLLSVITLQKPFIMVGHLFQNYDTIYVRFFPTYTCNHSCYTIYVRFFCRVYLRFTPKYMTIFLQTRLYMRTKKPIYMRYKQACGIWGHRKSSYNRHRIIPSAKKPFMYDAAEK